jgi:hypothetical protein
MHSGAPFAKRGGSELALPSMDVPISLLEWELFLPEQYKVKDFGGDAIAANLLPAAMVENDREQIASIFAYATGSFGTPESKEMDRLSVFPVAPPSGPMQPGQIGGIVVDQTGAVISGAQVKVTSLENGASTTTTTDGSGQWVVAAGMPSGRVRIEAMARGFQTSVGNVSYDAGRPLQFGARLKVRDASEVVEVTAESPMIETNTAHRGKKDRDKERDEKKAEALAQNGASSNVLNLQKRVAGVLPVRVDVPRAGNSYRFARALVLDEETKVTFSYKTK